MPYIWLTFHDTACIVGGIFLIINDHPVWAGVLFILAATTTIRQTAANK